MVTPPRSSHFGADVYAQFSQNMPVELKNEDGLHVRTLTFNSDNLTPEKIEQNPSISLDHTKADGETKTLKFNIGRNTALYKQIQELKGKGDQKAAIKALIAKYVAILLDTHEVGTNSLKSVTARFDPSTNKAVSLVGTDGQQIENRDYKTKKYGIQVKVLDHLSQVAYGTSKEGVHKFQSVFHRAVNPNAPKLTPSTNSPYLGGSSAADGITTQQQAAAAQLDAQLTDHDERITSAIQASEALLEADQTEETKAALSRIVDGYRGQQAEIEDLDLVQIPEEERSRFTEQINQLFLNLDALIEEFDVKIRNITQYPDGITHELRPIDQLSHLDQLSLFSEILEDEI
ncbi:MAG: hypothetical protein ACI8RA_002364, partial [Chlamydiales bacterium]